PGGYHPAADLLSDEETLKRLASIRQTIAHTVEQMPTQEQFLRDNGGAIDPALQLIACPPSPRPGRSLTRNRSTSPPSTPTSGRPARQPCSVDCQAAAPAV